jgi:outer membrane biosynthesis protein TonB
MAPNRILEDDELGSSVSPERPDTWSPVGKARAALSRHRVLLGSLGIAVVAVIAWRWTVRGESTPAPRAGVAATAPERQLEITVLGVHDIVAAAVPTEPPQPPIAAPQPPVAVPVPVAAPASAEPPPAPVSPPPRAIPAPRSAPSRAQSSAAKASPLPVAAVKSVPAQEPRVEIVPAKPQPKPDGPPMEANPYVYK